MHTHTHTDTHTDTHVHTRRMVFRRFTNLLVFVGF